MAGVLNTLIGKFSFCLTGAIGVNLSFGYWADFALVLPRTMLVVKASPLAEIVCSVVDFCTVTM